MKSFYLLLFLVFMVSCHKKKMSAEDSLQDSIEYYLGKINEEDDNTLKSIKFLEKADSLNNLGELDSIYFINRHKIAYAYSNFNLDQNFIDKTNVTLRIAINLKDTVSIARSYNALGTGYSNLLKGDSAIINYQKALKYYFALKNNDFIGRTYANISSEKYSYSDYIGAEKAASNALTFLRLSNNNELLCQSYLLLGGIYRHLNDLERSEDYLKKALDLATSKSLDSGNYLFLLETTLNNFSALRLKQKKYEEALMFINDALKNSKLEIEFPSLYSSLLLNRASTNIELNNYESAILDLETSFIINDKYSLHIEKVNSYLLYSSYYSKIGDQTRAFDYSKRAFEISKETNILYQQVESLNTLTKINDESFLNYAQEYITLNDSLISLERKNAEKFARIEFEADELEREKGELVQKNKTLWRWGSTSAVFLGLGFVIYFQRNSHRHLKNKQKQEELNLSVYRLMLSRQEELERARQEEKNRIAEELHDNIMNKMAAVRFNLTPLEFEPDPETVRKTLPYIHSIQDIEKEIRKLSHDLHREVFQSQQDYRALLEQLFNEYQNQKVRLFVEINKEVRWDRFSADQKMHLYRLLQEGITNVMKHAGATQLKIHLHLLKKDLFEMELEDNGKGMGALTQEGLGLKTMKKRVDAMGGNLHFSKVEPKGTLLQIHIPLQANDNSQK